MLPKRASHLGPLEFIPLVHVLLWGFYACLWRPVGDLGVETDFFGDYVPWARQWMTGHASLMSGYKGPTYYLVLGVFSRIVAFLGGDFHFPPAPGPEFLAGKLISVLASGVALLAIGSICRRIAAETLPQKAKAGAGVACALSLIVVATNPTFIDYSFRAGTDMFAVALAVAAVALALGAVRRAGYFGAGALLSLGYLTRYNNIVLLPALMLFAVLKCRGDSSPTVPAGHDDSSPATSKRRGDSSPAAPTRPDDSLAAAPTLHRIPSPAVRCAYLAAGFIAAAAPWWIYSLAVCGDPFYSRNVQNVAFEVFGAGRVSVDDFMAAGLPFDSAADLWRADPGAVVARLLGNVPRHLLFDMRQLLMWPVAILCAAGAVCAFLRSASRRLWLALTAAGVLLFGSSVPIYYGERYALPMLPFYALGCTGLAAALPGERIRRRGAWLVALGCLTLAIGYGAAMHRSVDPNRYYQPSEIRELAADLRSRGVPLDPDDAVAARKSHVGYWLGLRQARIPPGETIADIVRNLQKEGTRYLYIGYAELVLRPDLRPLADPAAPAVPAGLRRVGVGVRPMGDRLVPGVLYEVPAPAVRVIPDARPEGGAIRHPAPPGVPRAAFVKGALGNLLLRSGFSQPAGPLLEAAVAGSASWGDGEQWAGDACLLRGALDAARVHYERALAIDRVSPTAWARLAGAQMAAGRDDEARRSCEAAAKLGGWSDPATMGKRLFADREYCACLAPLLFAAESGSSDWEVWNDLGWIALRIQRNPGRARNYLLRAADLAPDPAEKQRIRALVAETQGPPR